MPLFRPLMTASDHALMTQKTLRGKVFAFSNDCVSVHFLSSYTPCHTLRKYTNFGVFLSDRRRAVPCFYGDYRWGGSRTGEVFLFSSDCDQTTDLLNEVAAGDSEALEQLLQLHRPYLKQIVQSRLNPALAVRVDASDIVQETQIEISKRIDDFIARRPTTFRIWIRRKALEKLVDEQRRHVAAKQRSVLRERHLSDVSSWAIARSLLHSSPSQRLRRVELQDQVRTLIEQLSEPQREVILFRHVEGLTNAEVGDLLGISPNTIRQRYGRALRQLHTLLAEHEIKLGGSMGG